MNGSCLCLYLGMSGRCLHAYVRLCHVFEFIHAVRMGIHVHTFDMHLLGIVFALFLVLFQKVEFDLVGLSP